MDIIDIDLSAKIDDKGNPANTTNGEAVRNAIQTYLQSRQGDYVFIPEVGGLLDRLDFRIIKSSYSAEESQILTNLNNRFSGVARVTSVRIVPVPTMRYLEINIDIIVLKTQEESRLQLFRKTSYDYVNSITYIEIPFEKENLIDFVQLKLMEQPKAPLYFNSDLRHWVWNSFKFINLSNDSDELPYLIELISSYNMSSN